MAWKQTHMLLLQLAEENTFHRAAHQAKHHLTSVSGQGARCWYNQQGRVEGRVAGIGHFPGEKNRKISLDMRLFVLVVVRKCKELSILGIGGKNMQIDIFFTFLIDGICYFIALGHKNLCSPQASLSPTAKEAAEGTHFRNDIWT